MSTNTTINMQTSHTALTKSLQEALDGASRNLKHCRAVLPFLIRTSHAPGTALNVPSDTHNNKDILEYLQLMYKDYKLCFSDKYSESNSSSSDGWKDL
jgi:hypothetical protein